MKLTIVEPRANGHHMVYVRYVAREALRRGWHLHLVTTPSSREHAACQRVLQECGDRLKTSTMEDISYPTSGTSTGRLLQRQWRQLQAFSRAYRETIQRESPDAIYLANLDFCDKAMALRGSPFGDTPFAGTLMQIRFHHRRMGVIGPASRQDLLYEKLFHRICALKTLRTFITNNEPLSDYASQARFHCWQKVRYVPDMAPLEGNASREEARRRFDIPDNRVVILIYGALSPRKGLAELLDALVHPQCPEQVAVLVAGLQDAVIQRLLATPSARRLADAGRLFEAVGFLSAEQEYCAFRAADIAWLGYRGFYGMSGVLVQAGAMGLPVVAGKEGIIGWLSSKHRLGEVVDPGDCLQTVRAIKQLAMNPALRADYGANGSQMACNHTPERFSKAICDAIQGP